MDSVVRAFVGSWVRSLGDHPDMDRWVLSDGPGELSKLEDPELRSLLLQVTQLSERQQTALKVMIQDRLKLSASRK